MILILQIALGVSLGVLLADCVIALANMFEEN
jgi:hypothetical protein